MTRDLVVDLVGARDGVTIVGAARERDLADAVARTGANVVILGVADDRVPDGVQRLLEERGLRVVVLTNRGRSSTVADLAPAYTYIEELTVDSLVAVLAGAAP